MPEFRASKPELGTSKSKFRNWSKNPRQRIQKKE
jgi:hypothetical protein